MRGVGELILLLQADAAHSSRYFAEDFRLAAVVVLGLVGCSAAADERTETAILVHRASMQATFSCAQPILPLVYIGLSSERRTELSRDLRHHP